MADVSNIYKITNRDPLRSLSLRTFSLAFIYCVLFVKPQGICLFRCSHYFQQVGNRLRWKTCLVEGLGEAGPWTPSPHPHLLAILTACQHSSRWGGYETSAFPGPALPRGKWVCSPTANRRVACERNVETGQFTSGFCVGLRYPNNELKKHQKEQHQPSPHHTHKFLK